GGQALGQEGGGVAQADPSGEVRGDRLDGPVVDADEVEQADAGLDGPVPELVGGGQAPLVGPGQVALEGAEVVGLQRLVPAARAGRPGAHVAGPRQRATATCASSTGLAQRSSTTAATPRTGPPPGP